MLTMEWDDPSLLKPAIPFVFTDGTSVIKDLGKTYATHKKGLFILGPSGIGKTHFINQQKRLDWIDGDILWYETNALPGGKWWESSLSEINRVESLCDIVTMEAKRCGFWIIGASNYWLKPDAIVVPDWQTHKKYIRARASSHYDGGATPENMEQLKAHRKIELAWKKLGVPNFPSVDAAVDYLI